MEREFMEINPQVWKPANEGDKIEGEYVKTKPGVGANESNLHCFHHENGGEFAVWGSVILDDRMAYIKPGNFVRITYKGQEKNKRGQPVNIYKVEVARQVNKTETIETDGHFDPKTFEEKIVGDINIPEYKE